MGGVGWRRRLGCDRAGQYFRPRALLASSAPLPARGVLHGRSISRALALVWRHKGRRRCLKEKRRKASIRSPPHPS